MGHAARAAVISLLLLAPAAQAGVELSAFTASVNAAGDVVLNWTTLSETNNFGFRIQRSRDDQTGYTTLPGLFVPGNGTTGVPHVYGITDTSATDGTWYYRLRQEDLDGDPHYSWGVLAHLGVFGQYLPDGAARLLLHLDETSGTLANDLSGNGRHGTVTGALPAAGRFAGARRFAGAGQVLRVADAPELRPSSLTIEAWVHADDFGAAPYAVIAARRLPGLDHTYRLAVIGATRRAVFTVRGAGTDSVEGAALPLENGRWHHLAGSYDGTTIRLRVNGLLQGERPGPGVLAYGDGGIFAGADSGGAFPFNGTVDEVRLSSGPRNPSTFNLQLRPESLTASLVGDGVRLQWQNGGGGVGLLRYRIGRETAPGVFTTVDSTTSPAYDDLDVPSVVSVTYAVTPVDSTGFAGVASLPVTIGVPPSPPALLLPAAGAVVDSLTVRFVWHPANRSTERYWLEYAADSLFTAPVIDSLRTDTTALAGGFAHDQVVWWRVRARNSAGWGGFAPARRLRTAFVVHVPLLAGWNMVSLPVLRSADSVAQIFPLSVNPYAFSFTLAQGYRQEPRLRNGIGYWAKLQSPHTQRVEGAPLAADTIHLEAGWNLVGSVAGPVDTADVVTIPPGLITTAFFGYTGSLTPVPTLLPGGAYWVKSASAGELILSAAGTRHRRVTPDPQRK